MSFQKEKALELVDLAQRNERLAHAYLITGPPGSGKQEVAIRLIEMTLPEKRPIESIDDLRSPTTVILGPESKSRSITVDAIRAAEHVLHMAAEKGVTKFTVIKDADCLGVQAENAFLKTLEEPPDGCRLILITARPEMLLDTILSRCIRIDLIGNTGPVTIPDKVRPFLEALKRHGPASQTGGISGALGLMAGFSNLLKQEKDLVAKENDASMKVETNLYQKTTEGSYLKQREEYYKALTESVYLDRRNQLLEYLLMWFGDALRQQSGSNRLDLPEFADATNQLAQSVSANELSKRVDAIDELRANLNTNATEALALEVGFIRAFG